MPGAILSPMLTRRSMILPETRKPRSLSYRGLMVPVYERASAAAENVTEAARTGCGAAT
jgi:hypothetical protein